MLDRVIPLRPLRRGITPQGGILGLRGFNFMQTEIKEQPGYYANLPASVRYDRRISSSSKLLFAELIALTNLKGFAWAHNSYFADLYGVSERSVREWLSELEKEGYITFKTINNVRYIYTIQEAWKKTSGGVEENFRGGRKKTSTLKTHNLENDGSAEPLKDSEIVPNTTFNTTNNSPADISSKSFEEFMEEKGYKQDSQVDDYGNDHKWWEDENGIKLKKGPLEALRKEWKRLTTPAVPKAPLDPAFATTENLCAVIEKVLKEQYGSAPIISNQTKNILRQNLVRKFDKDFLKAYAQWYFVDSQIEKKWRFSIPTFTSERMINAFLAETDYELP